MTTKEKLLTLFEKNNGVYFSGEEIADKLSVSRTAVWKAVNSLRKEGYKIHAAQNKGYCLAADTDILSVQGIQNRNTGNAVSLSGGKSLSFFRKEQKKLLPWMSMGNVG